MARAAKGRGAQSNASGRFEPERVEDFDDGWTRDEVARTAHMLFGSPTQTLVDSSLLAATASVVGVVSAVLTWVGM
jgi:hypothetical protein